jgi:hypothetical protein
VHQAKERRHSWEEGARSKARGKGKGKRLSKVKRAHSSRASRHKFEGLHYKLEDKLGLYQVPCVFTCCSICFEVSPLYIYIYLYIYWFSPWGFF